MITPPQRTSDGRPKGRPFSIGNKPLKLDIGESPVSDYILPMTFDDLRRLLELERDALRAQGVTALYVFGSVARGEATPASDVDVMIDYDSASGFVC